MCQLYLAPESVNVIQSTSTEVTSSELIQNSPESCTDLVLHADSWYKWTVLNHALSLSCMHIHDTKYLNQSHIVWMNRSESWADLTLHASLRHKVPKPKSHRLNESFWIIRWPHHACESATQSSEAKVTSYDWIVLNHDLLTAILMAGSCSFPGC